MPNTKSAKKRMRQNLKRRLHNRFYKKRTKSFVKRLLNMESYEDARKFLPYVISEIDKLAKRHIWHKNKANRFKSRVARYVHSLYVKQQATTE